MMSLEHLSLPDKIIEVMCTKTNIDIDIEELNHKYDNIIKKEYPVIGYDSAIKYKPLILDIIDILKKTTHSEKLDHVGIKSAMRRHAFSGKNSAAFQVFTKLLELDDPDVHVKDTAIIRDALKIKRLKSHSGVLVITIFTSPNPEYLDENGVLVTQEFSCHWNCAYCPNEPGQPRSYLKGEPGVLRANKNKFDCVKQMWDRMKTLYVIGHNVDKLEVIVLGGTWASYPLAYREQFIRDIYYAANTFSNAIGIPRERLSLTDEKRINQNAATRVIGLTLETRPDCINIDEIKRFRYYGCTRVQLGIQHLHEDVLNVIKRRCTTKHVEDAIRLLKDSCFKIDGHFMPNLPGTTPEKDVDMLIDTLLGMRTPIIKRWTRDALEFEDWNLSSPEFQLDQWKVYPCAITPWTDIEQWYRQGTYIPYNETCLVDLLIKMKTLMFPWIRLNRIIRDIPSDYIIESSDKSNMRQELAHIMKVEGTRCNCIRCREVKETAWDGEYVTRVRRYNASNGIEYFVAAESKDANTLYGFLRLRISQSPNTDAFPELLDCGMIRELHVYGQLQHVGGASSHVQHRGIGKHLVATAEHIAKHMHGVHKMAVIAGEGTKMYYTKCGYNEHMGHGSFMIRIL